MAFFSKKKYEDTTYQEEITPLKDISASTIKQTWREIENSGSSFFDPTLVIGSLQIDDKQGMWRSMSFNEHIAFLFSEIISIERGEEAIYSTMGHSVGKISGHTIGANSAHLSASFANGNINQTSASITKSSRIQIVSVYTNTKYNNVTIEASSPAEAKNIYDTLESRIRNTMEKTAKKEDHAHAPQNSSADEIRKYKELLDDGIITEEEFLAKKKQLLGL